MLTNNSNRRVREMKRKVFTDGNGSNHIFVEGLGEYSPKNDHDLLVEENQRLTAIATKHATVNDERYELLEKQKADIEKMLDQLFRHEKVDGWLVCKMNDMLDDVNHQLDKSRIEAEKGDGI